MEIILSRNPLSPLDIEVFEFEWFEGSILNDVVEQADMFGQCVFEINGRFEDQYNYLIEQGDHVTVRRDVAGDDPLRTLALVALSVAAPYIGAAGAGALGVTGGMGVTAASGLTVGGYSAAAVAATQAAIGSLSYMAGTALINKVLPVKTPDQTAVEDLYYLRSSNNQSRFGGLMPVIMGKTKFVPDLASRTYTAWEGQDQYLYQIYGFGNSDNVEFTDLLIGDTPLNLLDDVETQWSDTEGKLTLFPANVDVAAGRVFEDTDDELIIRTPVDTTRIDVDFELTLVRYKDGKELENTVQFSLEYRTVGSGGSTGAWQPLNNGADSPYIYTTQTRVTDCSTQVEHGDGNYECSWYYEPTIQTRDDGTVIFANSSAQPFRESLGKAVELGQYDVRVVRQSGETGSSRIDRMSVYQVRSQQPDTGAYANQRRLAVRAKATAQLNGSFGQLSCMADAKIDGVSSSNPADWFKFYLKGKDSEYGAFCPPSLIDDASIADWKDWCTVNNLEFGYVFTQPSTAGDTLDLIARSGQAFTDFSAGKVGVRYNDSSQPITQAFNDSNIIDGTFSITYPTQQNITGLTIEYVDKDDDYNVNTLQIGNAPFQNIFVPGVTTREQAWVEINLAWNEQRLLKRVVSFETNMIGALVSRWDLINTTGESTYNGAKTCKVLSIANTAPDTYRITAREELIDYYAVQVNENTPSYGYSIFGWEGGIGSGDSPNPPSTVYNSYIAKNIDVSTSFSISNGRLYLHVLWTNIMCSGSHIALDSSGGSGRREHVYGGGHTFEIEDKEQTITLTLTPVSLVSGAQSLEKTTEIIYYDPKSGLQTQFIPSIPDVTGLQLNELTSIEGVPNFYEFLGKYAHIEWRSVNTEDNSFGNEPLSSGADSGTVDDWFKDYEVRVYDDNQNILRIEHVTDASYIYTYDKNIIDNGGTPTRKLRFEVVARGSQNQQSGNPARITVSNPPPNQPSALDISEGIGSIAVIVNDPQDPDFAGYLVWASTDSNFTPTGYSAGTGNCVYDGYNPLFKVESGETYYVIIAPYDTFGKDALNHSPSFTATSILIEAIDINEVATDQLLKDHGIIDSSGLIGPQLVGGGSLAVNAVGPNHISNTTTDALLKDHGVIDSSGLIGADLVVGSSLGDNAVGSNHVSNTTVDTLLKAHGVINNLGKIGSQLVGNGALATNAVDIDALDIAGLIADSQSMGQFWSGISGFNTIVADSATIADTLNVTNFLGETAKVNQLWAGIVSVNTIVADNAIIADTLDVTNFLAESAKVTELWTGIQYSQAIYADHVTAGGVTALSVGANEIITSSANIGNAVIKTAHMGTAVIANAHIKDLTVDTLKIKNRAISIPNVSIIDTDIQIPVPYQQIAEITHVPAHYNSDGDSDDPNNLYNDIWVSVCFNVAGLWNGVGNFGFINIRMWRTTYPLLNPATLSSYTHYPNGVAIVNPTAELIMPHFTTLTCDSTTVPASQQVTFNRIDSLPNEWYPCVYAKYRVEVQAANYATIGCDNRTITTLEIRK